LVSKGGEAARNVDEPNRGYYASAKEDYDITGFDSTDPARKLVNWDIDGSCAYATSGTCDALTRPSDVQAVDDTGLMRIEARYLITRLCTTAGIDAKGTSNNNCAVALKASMMKNQNAGAIDQTSTRNFELQNQQPFYRIVVRVKGPRNAVTYTETIVNLAS